MELCNSICRGGPTCSDARRYSAGILTGIVTALFAGMLSPSGIQIAIFAMISCAAAVYGIGRYRERQSVTLAGLITGCINVLMALALIAYAEQPFTVNTVLLAIGCGFAGGLLTAIFTAGGLPVNESLFGILTDVKLLELSNADLPVLGQLALRAPGTNQHSHAVGQLAEDACRAVGANPLLARIGASITTSERWLLLTISWRTNKARILMITCGRPKARRSSPAT